MKFFLFPPEKTPRDRLSRGFSLLELLIVLGALSSVIAMGFMNLSVTPSAVKAAKLRQDVAALNTAVRTYLLSGGDLSTATEGGTVIAKLKTTAAAASRSKLAGLRGSMVDLRLRGVVSSGSNESKAVWDHAKKTFVVQTSGTGFSEFVLDSDLPSAPVEESRHNMMSMNSADKWIWAFEEQRPTAATPRAGAVAVDSPVFSQTAAPSMTVLQAPAFSKPPGLYDYSAYDPDLKISLVDRNTINAAETYFCIAGGAWIKWNGTPLSLPRSLSTEIRAYSTPLNPDRFEQSAIVEGLYETIFFSGNSSGLFKNPLGDSALVSNLLGGLSNSLFNWGSPATASGFTTPNSLTFTGKTFASVAPDQLFELGNLAYFNATTYTGTNASSIQLSVSLNLTTLGVVENLPFTFNLLSTSNKGKNADEDADYVYIPKVSTKFNTVIKGQTFYLVLSFGSNNGNGFTTIDEFHARENKTLTGSIYGKFTTTPALP